MTTKYKLIFFKTLYLCLICLVPFKIISQEIDVDELLERLDRIEKNISDLQKGKIEEFEKNLSPSYISRNETKLGDFETKIRTNFGLVEEIDNRVQNVDEKVDLIDKDLKSRINNVEKKLKKLNESQSKKRPSFKDTISNNKSVLPDNSIVGEQTKSQNLNSEQTLNDIEIKKKYENAIKLLWANKYEKAEEELIALKNIQPVDLMPNIQYWLGEVYYAKKNFQQAVIEFGEGFTNYPDSIKGPDNLLKLGLSFSNLNKKNEACSAFYELEVKYKNSPKNVIERSQEERKKLKCPKE